MTAKTSTITLTQLAGLLSAYSIGSAIVFIPNPLSAAAGNDAWLSITAAYLFGMLVFACVLYLYHAHNGVNLIAYSRTLIGKSLTVIISIPIIGMLFFAISAINSSIGDFFTSVMMEQTPPYVFHSIGMLLSALTARAGIRVAARMFLLLLVIMLLFSLLVIVLAIPIYKPGQLLPMFDHGLKPVLHGFFIAAGFPFGEICLFSMLLPFVKTINKQSINKKLYYAFSFAGLMLLISTLSTTMAFGPAAGVFNYSLYRLAVEIHIAELFQRVEAIIGIALILGSYMKATLLLMILNYVFIELLRIKDDKIFIYPLALVCIFLSLTMFKSPADFQEQVYLIWPFSVLAVGCFLVFLFTFITWIKKITIKE
ncbi:GerAB/ArcD/ProY family transporter [Paenibacillus sinopodophylli]|uniref:GerAB/ArcD/ProY family transporter n=1 Tax=Paenibacillus sinopodophylli TaxID=1837342 RepID=UPI00110CD44D|nr:endospore germination permease [Paenibacillus sinopodophylli]